MTIRISGMSSGMDIDKIVSELMKAERIPLTNKIQKKTLAEYRMDLYRDVNSKLMTLRDSINKMRFSADFSAVKAASSNENAVKVSGSNPSKVTTSIEVKNLATQANKQSAGKVTTGTGLDLSKSLADNASSFQNAPDVASADMEMTINGVDISYSGTDTIQNIINKVNKSDAGVALSYDSAADKFVFISKQTGKEAEIEAEDTTGTFLSAIKMDGTTFKPGEDATVVINGVESERSSNSFTQDGVTYTLLQQTSSAVTITNSSDTNAIVDKIKGFVTAYNEVQALVNKLTDEKLARGYAPLTSDQKAGMNEEDIKNWEKLSRQGLLKNDSILDTFSRTTRSFLSQKGIDGMTPLDFGLGTSSFQGNVKDFSSAAGVIVLDEARLIKALEENPEAVEAMFTRTSSTAGEEGLFQKLYNQLNTTITDITKKSGKMGGSYIDITNTLGKQSSKLELEIKMLEDKMIMKENVFYKQFAAMEKAMANSNSQMSFLTQNMGY